MPIRTLRAVRDLGINKGATGPHFMECSDGKTYLVKFADGTKTAANEYAGHALSHRLGLPVPPNALVELGPEVIAASEDLRNREIAPGLHHGSEIMPDARDFEDLEKKNPGVRFDVLNFSEIPGIVCLDNWIMTQDRHRKGNHLLQQTAKGFVYYTVDFSHSFTGPNWTAESLSQASTIKQPAPSSSMVEATISGMSSVEPVLRKIESVSDAELETLVADIPGAWLAGEEALSLSSFLRVRRQLVREVVTQHLTAPSPGM